MTGEGQMGQEPPVSPQTAEGGPVGKERPGATSTPPSDPRIPHVEDPTDEGGQERGDAAPSVHP